MTRFGVVLGVILGSKMEPLFPQIYVGRSCFRSRCLMVPRWQSRPSKRALGGGLGPSWGGLGSLLGALGPSLAGLGGLLGRLEGVLGCSWRLLGSLGWSFGVVLDVVLGFDSLIRFIDPISIQ